MLTEAFERFRNRRGGQAQVTPGAVFQHETRDHAMETAEVIDLPRDDIGIAHVRFRVRITRDDATFVDEERILALESFRARFGNGASVGVAR